jgi:hypothetical protein
MIISMIDNEHHFQVTQNQATRFEIALEALEQNPRPDLHPLLRKAQQESILSMLETLRKKLATYKTL